MRSKCIYRLMALLGILLSLSGCMSNYAVNPLQDTLAEVDLQRYMGRWYEIASFPNWFQKGCLCSAADYSLRVGFVEVRNSCRKDSQDGATDVAVGKAFIVPGSGNSKLKVQFQWPFRGDYWIIALDDNYRYAMVGHPKRKYLWILSRAKHMDNATFEQLREIARSKGYDTDRLQKTEQSCGN